MRSHKYEEGRRQALEALGLKQRPKDTPSVSGFIKGLGEDKVRKPSDKKLNRLDRPTSWGPKFTIPAEDAGVGV